MCDRDRSTGNWEWEVKERSWLKERSVCICVCMEGGEGGSVTLHLSGGFTPQQANGQTIHPYLPCSMPVPLDWRELDPTSRGEFFSIWRIPLKVFFCPPLFHSPLLCLSGSFPVEVELSHPPLLHTHTNTETHNHQNAGLQGPFSRPVTFTVSTCCPRKTTASVTTATVEKLYRVYFCSCRNCDCCPSGVRKERSHEREWEDV